MNSTLHIIFLGTVFAVGACEQKTAVSQDDSVLEIARETGFDVIDVSVPFERFDEAPTRLQRIADVLRTGSPGLYVMRYYDDTLRHTNHVFVIRQSGSTYIEMTSYPTEMPTREEFEINTAEYDDRTKTLILQSRTGSIRLAPADVTPVGA